jgi:hypothetical protein
MRQSALGRAYKNWTLKTAPICHRQRSELAQQMRALPSRNARRMILVILFPVDGKSWRANQRFFSRESTLKHSSRAGIEFLPKAKRKSHLHANDEGAISPISDLVVLELPSNAQNRFGLYECQAKVAGLSRPSLRRRSAYNSSFITSKHSVSTQAVSTQH